MTTVRLAPVLDLNAAAPLQAALLAAQGHDLAIDAAEVDRLGGLCLQVLIAARRSWARDGRECRLVNLSEQCRDALRLAQAGAALGVEK